MHRLQRYLPALDATAWPEGRDAGGQPQRRIYGSEELRLSGALGASLLRVEVRLSGCGTAPQNQAVALQLRRWRTAEQGEEELALVAETERRL